MAICPHCGREVPDDAIVCPYCGTQLSPDVAVCGNCGRLIPADAKVCPYCGAELSDTARCPNCGREIPATSESCPYCGFRFDKDHPLVKIEYKKRMDNSKNITIKPLSAPTLTMYDNTFLRNYIPLGEKILYYEHPSMVPMVIGIFLMIFLVPVLSYIYADFTLGTNFLMFTGIFYLIFFVLLFLPFFIYFLSLTYIITQNRVIILKKLISVAVKEIPVKEVSYVDYRQRFTQRILKIGDINIHSSGGKLRFYNAPKPNEVKNLIQSLR